METSLFYRRIKSIILDSLLIYIVAGILAIVILLVNQNVNLTLYYIMCISILYSSFLCKDIINGQSFGKKKSKLQVTDNKGNVVSIQRLVLRNIFVFIWPMEILMLIINQEKRLGDIIFKTRVVSVINGKIISYNFEKKYIFICYIIVFLLSFCVFVGVYVGMKSISNSSIL